MQFAKLRKVLTTAIESENTSPSVRELALRVMLRMGLVNSSGEELLLVADY